MLRSAWLLVALLTLLPAAWGGQVYVIELGKDDPQQLTTDDGLACGSPVWSHDGKRIAFDAWPLEKTHVNADVHVISAKGGPATKLGPGAVSSWSPDDRLILCSQFVPRPAIRVMSADGTESEEMLKGFYSPRWMADNSTFAVLSSRGLVKFDLTKGETTLIANIPFPQPGFSYSPTTNRFFVVDTRTWTLLLVEHEANAGTWTVRPRWRNDLPRPFPLVNSTGIIGQISWAPDGKRAVLAIGDARIDRRLYVIDADNQEDPQPLPGVPEDWISCNPNWSPDGKRIAFVRLEPKPPIEAPERPRTPHFPEIY